MQKTEFIEHVAKEANVTRSEADKIVRASLKVIENALKSGEKVTLTGFGSFEVRERGEREVTSIRTKQKVTVPASRLPGFSAGSELKAAVNNKLTGAAGRAAAAAEKAGGAGAEGGATAKTETKAKAGAEGGATAKTETKANTGGGAAAKTGAAKTGAAGASTTTATADKTGTGTNTGTGSKGGKGKK